jgi:GYF domain 2
VNPVENNPTDAWIVRVQGKEYGPVDLEELRGWKEEGRLIRENEIREPGSEQWIPAGELPELFADETPAPTVPPTIVRQSTLGAILVRTWQIYRERFGQFLGLSALVIVPSLCAQLSSAAAAGSSELDLRTALSGLFNFAMIAASFIAWPIYVAGLQILTSEAAQGRFIALQELVLRALKYWSRVALLCVLVYGAFFLLLVLAFAILVMVAAGPPNLLVILVALALLIFQVWMFGRVFVNVLFWQQAAVLEDAGVADSLRRSKEMAQSRRDLPWWRRPLWRGVIISSLWCLLATALSIGPEWSTLNAYYHTLTTTQDAQAIVQSLSAAAKPAALTVWPIALGVLQTILRPLLGIGFVLLYLDLRATPND